MARKSRVAGNTVSVASVEKGTYKVGVYARLSSENSTENTLDNQIYLLENYVDRQEDMRLVNRYMDNGFSGTNFQRPGFLKMMEDAKNGKINCIVVKDLSRLGRNYIETGNIIENIFPFLNIRFVAVTDGFDTNVGDGMHTMVASIKNLVNDVYAKDISRKIISSFRTKQKNGEYIGLVAPYGYLKSKENKNKFVVDAETVPVVRRIFQLYADGKGLDTIVRILNEDGIDCPRKYRHGIGVTTSERYKNSHWGRSAVKTILTNRAYIGDMVQGKVKQELCNNLSKQYVEEQEWIVVEGTHEAVVERELFFSVQDKLEQKSREQVEKREKSAIKDHKEENFLKGYLRCGCCGKSFNLAQNMRGDKITRQYYCSGYQTLRLAFCTNKDRVAKDELEKTVMECIQACILQFVEDGLLRQRKPEAVEDLGKARIVKIDRELAALAGKLADLYQDIADRILDDADYMLIRTEFLKQKEDLEREKSNLLREAEMKQKRGTGMSVPAKLKKYRIAKKLNREMVECFVDGIRIFEGRRIEVSLLCRDEILKR